MYVLKQLLSELLAYARQSYYQDPARFQRQAIGSGILFVIVFGVTTSLVLRWMSTPSAYTLFVRATRSSVAAEQTTATQSLKRDYPDSTYLIRLAKESTNPDVVSLALASIEGRRNYSAIGTVFDLLAHNDATVRTRAKQAAATLLGRDYGYPVHGTTQEQQAILTKMREDWDALQGSELFNFNHTRFQ